MPPITARTEEADNVPKTTTNKMAVHFKVDINPEANFYQEVEELLGGGDENYNIDNALKMITAAGM